MRTHKHLQYGGYAKVPLFVGDKSVAQELARLLFRSTAGFTVDFHYDAFIAQLGCRLRTHNNHMTTKIVFSCFFKYNIIQVNNKT